MDTDDLVPATDGTGWEALVRQSLLGLEPYRLGPGVDELKEQYGLASLAKLNWNEGLFGPLPGALEAAEAALARSWMYPEVAYSELRDALSAWLEVPREWIVPAHGIQALVGTIASALLEPGDRTVVCRPSYGLYPQVFTAHGAEVERVPTLDHRLDLEAMAMAADRLRAKLVVVVDPNNPTGSHVEADEWESFLRALPRDCVVVADEAYGEYVDPERRFRREDDIEAGRPVIVLRTFSKIFGLAGLRLGYAIVATPLASYLDIVQEPFNVNRPALAAGVASLRRPELVEERRQEAAEARSLLSGLLEEAGCEVVASQANFVLAQVGVDELALAEGLLRRGFLVRPGTEYGLTGFVRITVAPAPVMKAVAAAVAEVRRGL